uniref:Cubilin-like n=1 Tax=Crassostrea virginica TaxID=6565 RepID=A0A8B8DG27_CRAVI|nr:cubilin-like [Crassostrea virginica]
MHYNYEQTGRSVNSLMMYCFVFVYLTITFTLTEKTTCAVEQTFQVNGTSNGSSGEITSPGYPANYPDNVNYTWILRTGHLNANVTFTILDSDISEPYFPPCDDYLQITEKEPCCWQALKRCGQFHPFSMTVKGKEIAITFVTDKSRNAKGFRLIWKVHLPELITTMISTTPMMTTTLKTTTTVPTTKLSTLRTNLMERTSQPFTTPVNSPHVSSTFNNPNNKTTTKKEKPSSILGGREILNFEDNIGGHITSPGYPAHYPDNINYTWILRSRHMTRIDIRIIHMNILQQVPCGDYLEIEEIDPCCFLLFKHCGNLSALNVHGRGKKIRVSFVSDSRETAQGFTLNWTGEALLPLRTLFYNVS